MRKPILIAGTLTNMLLTACLLCLSMRPRHHITEENYGKVVEGMTEQEVEVIFGGPPGDYGPGKAHTLPRVTSGFELAKEAAEPAKEWQIGEVAYRIGFGPDGKVHWKAKEPVVRDTLVDRVRHWLGI